MNLQFLQDGLKSSSTPNIFQKTYFLLLTSRLRGRTQRASSGVARYIMYGADPIVMSLPPRNDNRSELGLHCVIEQLIQYMGLSELGAATRVNHECTALVAESGRRPSGAAS